MLELVIRLIFAAVLAAVCLIFVLGLVLIGTAVFDRFQR